MDRSIHKSQFYHKTLNVRPMPRAKTMEDIHGEKDEEQGINENSPNKKIEEAKEHHLDEDALDTT